MRPYDWLDEAPGIAALVLLIVLVAIVCFGMGSAAAQRDIAAKCDADGAAAIAGSAYRCDRITHKAETAK